MQRVGVAGWSIPAALADRFPTDGSHLERYATRFNAVEINSSFYRPHRRATYERWADSVPPDFRFAVKLPKAITHERRLVDCDDLVTRFADEIGGLGEKRGPVLIQLPPRLAYPIDGASAFFETLSMSLGGSIVCEPRHVSWFTADVDAMLRHHRVARVAADPAPVPAAAQPAGWEGIRYFRLHGTPRVYWSAYSGLAIENHACALEAIEAKGTEVWTIFDNTAAGAAPDDALSLLRHLADRYDDDRSTPG